MEAFFYVSVELLKRLYQNQTKTSKLGESLNKTRQIAPPDNRPSL